MNTNISSLIAADIGSVMHNGMSVSEKLSFSGKMFLMGMGTVFVVLIVIWLVLSLFRFFAYDIPNKKKNADLQNNDIAENNISSPVAHPDDNITKSEDSQLQNANDDADLIAVITAAVCAYRDSESDSPGYALPFRVVSYKRKKSGTAWNSAITE